MEMKTINPRTDQHTFPILADGRTDATDKEPGRHKRPIILRHLDTTSARSLYNELWKEQYPLPKIRRIVPTMPISAEDHPDLERGILGWRYPRMKTIRRR